MNKKSGGDSGPQPAVNVPQPPTMSQNIEEYIRLYPKLFDLEKQYSPQEAQLQLDLLNQYGPKFNDYLVSQQKELTPYTYGLQEQLAQLASDNMGGRLPNRLSDVYVDQFRSEIGPNIGSGVGADYVSSNMAKLNEDYSRYYQNLGLSLINRIPMNSISPTTPNFSNPAGNFGIGDLSRYNQGNYGSYVGALVSQPLYYPRSGGSGGFNTQGAIGGGFSGAQAGSAFGPWGTAIGGALGAFGGGYS